MEEFNKCIEDLLLMEIKKMGAKYTWTNKQIRPIFSNIGRIFASTEWENKFPLCSAYGILTVGSDHSLIILDTGEQNIKRECQFFFEKQWLQQEGFREGAAKRWELVKSGISEQAYSMEVWHMCVKGTRQFMKGWANNQRGDYRRKKGRVNKIYK